MYTRDLARRAFLADIVLNALLRQQDRRTQVVRLGLWGAFTRPGVVLRGDRVLVDEAAEPVVHADRGR